MRAVLLLAAASDLPVVLVPGLMSSQIMMRIGEDYAPPHSGCPEGHADDSQWFRSWIDGVDMLPYQPQCLMHRLSTPWGPDGPQNQAGVETRVEGFGTTDSLEELSANLKCITTVYGKLVDEMVDQGWERGRTLRGAPYDWRYSPYEGGREAVEQLRVLIEETATLHGKVLLVSHSMGAHYTLALLSQVGPEWQRKHLRGWVSLAGVFGGATEALASLLNGATMGIPTLNAEDARRAARTWESSWLLLPNPQVFEDRVLGKVVHDDGTADEYTARDLEPLFDDEDWDSGVDPAVALRRQAAHAAPLGAEVAVPLHCLYSTGVPTVSSLTLGLDPWAPWDEATTPAGDGTVDLVSLEACKTLRASAGVSTTVYEGINHRGMLTDQRVLFDVLDIAIEQQAAVVV